MQKPIIKKLFNSHSLMKFWKHDAPSGNRDEQRFNEKIAKEKRADSRSPFRPSCALQFLHVRSNSSPSLSSEPAEEVLRAPPSSATTPFHSRRTTKGTTRSITVPCVGELQKVKRSLTQLYNSQSQSKRQDGKAHTGGVIWRTTKERRKAKRNRRQTCLSGDSGIEAELEKYEQYARVIAAGSGVSSAVVKRTSSDRAGTVAIGIFYTATMAMTGSQARVTPESELSPALRPRRSLSQPNGLNVTDNADANTADLEDSESDSENSHDDVTHFSPTYAEVLYNFQATEPQELALERGTLVEILRQRAGLWWFGRRKQREWRLPEDLLEPEVGWFPKEFVRIIHCPESDLFYRRQTVKRTTPRNTVADDTITSSSDATIADDGDEEENSPCEGPLNVNPDHNIIIDTNDILRRNAIKELLDTEVNYVNLLTSICEGYLPAVEKRADIFSPGSVRLIFSNIIGIYRFQKKFLEALRKGIEQNQVAKVFLKMHKGFLCYSPFCNDYPRALVKLKSFEQRHDAKTILDKCCESVHHNMPLSSQLIAPVQRICRYQLHLAEIMKATPSQGTELRGSELQQVLEGEHALGEGDLVDSKETINFALEAIKGITEAVDEGKQHSETLATHQASFQKFKGPPLHVHSTRFFLQINATRQSQNLWNSSYTLFLFDNQLVYCKRDLIKRSQFIYKGRIMLDRCRVVNVRDGKMFGHTIKNSLRIYCESLDKWYDFSFRSANRKHRFLSTLALERQFGSKPLYVQEMTGYEYAFVEREYSDQSDFEAQDNACDGFGTLSRLRLREYSKETSTGPTRPTSSSTGGSDTSPTKPLSTLVLGHQISYGKPKQMANVSNH